MIDGRYIMTPIEEYNEYLKLKEKNKPKIPKVRGGRTVCPTCQKRLRLVHKYKHCGRCGQALEWRDYE